MWIGIFSGLFSIPALLGLWVSVREILRALGGAKPVRWERIGLAALILTGRWWMPLMRPCFWEPLARTMGRFPKPFEAFARLTWQMGCIHAALMFGTHVGHESRGQDDLLADRCAHFSMRAAGRGALSCFDYNTRPLLPTLKLPVLLLTGDCDRNMPPDIQRSMASRLPRAELVLIENCGHLSLLECHEEISAALADFARRCLTPNPAASNRVSSRL